MRRSALLLLAMTLTTSALRADTPRLTDDEIRRSVSVTQHMGGQLPLDVVLRDERGKLVKIGSQFGKRPVIITPVYYSCPMLCNITLDTLIGRMADMKLTAGKDFDVLTYSFDSMETAPEAEAKRTLYLRRYGRAGAGEGWHFYTGDEKSVRRLSDALGFGYTYDPVKKQYAHAAITAIATPDGKISRYFYGMDYTPRDLRFGLVDASGGKIGTATDKLLMLCYDYNPATGKYSATAMNIVRVGGTASVLGLAGFIFISIRKERLAAKR